ncbi:MAG: hypothetical protein QOI68_5052, partial [Pseudonocardiales bacterium]|nr:hypothetical protein [Pseudonocardiales bacterium]
MADLRAQLVRLRAQLVRQLVRLRAELVRLRTQLVRRKPVTAMAAETGADSGAGELSRTIGL